MDTDRWYDIDEVDGMLEEHIQDLVRDNENYHYKLAMLVLFSDGSWTMLESGGGNSVSGNNVNGREPARVMKIDLEP